MESLQIEIINFAIVLLTALLGFITKHLVSYLKNKGVIAKLESHKNITSIAVQAVEQGYKHLHGKEKLNVAKIEIIKMAKSKGIKVTEKELDLLIESAVKEMNQVARREMK